MILDRVIRSALRRGVARTGAGVITHPFIAEAFEKLCDCEACRRGRTLGKHYVAGYSVKMLDQFLDMHDRLVEEAIDNRHESEIEG